MATCMDHDGTRFADNITDIAVLYNENDTISIKVSTKLQEVICPLSAAATMVTPQSTPVHIEQTEKNLPKMKGLVIIMTEELQSCAKDTWLRMYKQAIGKKKNILIIESNFHGQMPDGLGSHEILDATDRYFSHQIKVVLKNWNEGFNRLDMAVMSGDVKLCNKLSKIESLKKESKILNYKSKRKLPPNSLKQLYENESLTGIKEFPLKFKSTTVAFLKDLKYLRDKEKKKILLFMCDKFDVIADGTLKLHVISVEDLQGNILFPENEESYNSSDEESDDAELTDSSDEATANTTLAVGTSGYNEAVATEEEDGNITGPAESKKDSALGSSIASASVPSAQPKHFAPAETEDRKDLGGTRSTMKAPEESRDSAVGSSVAGGAAVDPGTSMQASEFPPPEPDDKMEISGGARPKTKK